jgi:hypothetical protein
MNEITRQFIAEHRLDDVQKLALQSKFFADSGIDKTFALTQIAGRQIIAHKIPSWYQSDDLMYPARLSLEQCSSETTARYKASLLSGRSFADLTGGFGVDTAFIAGQFPQAAYVERQTELASIARHNFSVLGLNHIQIYPMDGVPFLLEMDPVDCLYLDPARRSGTGQKVVLIEDCEPNVIEIKDLLLEKAGTVLIKLSPMLDIHAALKALNPVSEVHIVSVENECKELLFLLRKDHRQEPVITCINFGKQGNQTEIISLSEEKTASISCTSDVKEYLYEPNASLLKAGFYKGIAWRYAVEKLHPDSHLYTSEQLIPDFPGRIFQVETVSSFNKKDLKEMLNGTGQANISVRNFPLPVLELRKKLKLQEGGGVYLFATTLSDGKHVIIKCRRGAHLSKQ